jgi:hypothetical protein
MVKRYVSKSSTSSINVFEAGVGSVHPSDIGFPLLSVVLRHTHSVRLSYSLHIVSFLVIQGIHGNSQALIDECVQDGRSARTSMEPACRK